MNVSRGTRHWVNIVSLGIFYSKRTSIKITMMVTNRRRDLFKLMDRRYISMDMLYDDNIIFIEIRRHLE